MSWLCGIMVSSRGRRAVNLNRRSHRAFHPLIAYGWLGLFQQITLILLPLKNRPWINFNIRTDLSRACKDLTQQPGMKLAPLAHRVFVNHACLFAITVCTWAAAQLWPCEVLTPTGTHKLRTPPVCGKSEAGPSTHGPTEVHCLCVAAGDDGGEWAGQSKEKHVFRRQFRCLQVPLADVRWYDWFWLGGPLIAWLGAWPRGPRGPKP